jgi:hypothetical protein
MSKSNDDTWLFLVEWFDPMPRIKKQYILKFFIKQHQVEMIDLKVNLKIIIIIIIIIYYY